ncbi:recombinase family protein [Nonomuraea sp. NPDC049646]|uniref:recombinase family protein n=1 Tax=unclassified Nonomuraea TaxID=2593643 RepID=UPI0037B9AD81
MARLERTGLRWGIYARLSADKRKGTELEEIGVGAQIEEVRQRLISVWDPDGQIIDIYVDNDVPASGRMTKRKQRPEYRRMQADAKRGRIQAVGAYHVDRYTRRPKEFEELVDIHDAHGTIFASLHGDIDLTTPAGRLFARMLSNYGAYQGEHKVEQMKTAYAALARSGKRHSGGMRCYGYSEDDKELIAEEVDIIKEAAERVLPPNPESMRSLVREFAERGIKSSTGKDWTQTALRRLLENPRLTGRRLYRGEVVAEEVFPRVFTDEEHARIVAFLTDPGRRTFDERRTYLLSGGIALCGKCGARLQAQPSNSKRRGYVCRKRPPYAGCGGIRIMAEEFEAYVAAEVLAHYASPKVRQKIVAAASPGTEGSAAQRIAQLEERLAELGRERARGEIDPIAFRAAQNVLQDDIRKLKGKIVEAERLAGLPAQLPTTPAALAEWWLDENTSMEQQRALIMAVLDHVTVGPVIMRGNNEFEPERINFVWK